MEEKQTILIDVQIDTEKVASELVKVTASVNSLKDAQKGLQQEFQKTQKQLDELGSRTEENADEFDALTEQLNANRQAFSENEQAIKLLQATQKSLQGQLQQEASDFSKVGTSIKEQSALLAQLKSNYRSLSEEQRNSKGGEELKKRIQDLDKTIKEADASLGDHQRNVGNYPQTLASVIPGFGKAQAAMGKFGVSLDDLGTKGALSFKGLIAGAKSLGKAFLTPPVGVIVVVLAAIMKAVEKVKGAFEKNDDAMTNLQKGFAVFKPIGTAVSKIFDGLATVIGKVVGVMGKGVQAVSGFLEKIHLLPKGTTAAAKAAEELVVAEDNLQEAERQYTVNSAKWNQEISDLRAKVAEKDKYTAQERKDMLEQAIQLEEQKANEEVKIAEERLRILEAQAAQEVNTSDETKNKIAQATAELYNVRANYSSKTKELNAQRAELNKKITDEEQAEIAKRKDAWQKHVEHMKAIAETQKQVAEELQDALLDIMEDGTEKQVAAVELSYGREIAALKQRLATEKDLTEQAQNDLARLIEIKTQQMTDETQRIRKEAAEKQAAEQAAIAQRELDVLRQLEDAKIAAMQEGEEKRIAEIQIQGEREIAALQQRLETEKNLTAQEMDAIGQLITLKRQEIAQQVQEVEDRAFAERYAKMQEQQDWEFQNKLAKVQGNDVAVAQLELENALAQQQQLLSMDEQTKLMLGISQEEYERMVTESNQRVADSSNQLAISQANAAASTLSAIGGLLDSVMALSEDASMSEAERVQKEKKMAIANAAIQSGIAIATGVSQAMAVPFPGNIAAIITTIAAIISNIATAKKTIQSADTNFATGGIVPGTSYSGDNVPVNVNSGEMILNKQQQAQLFDIANNGNTGGGIDYNAMAQAMAQAVRTLPAPVLVYSQFEDFVQTNEQTIKLSEL